jgi:hypothetical protein
MIFKDQFVKLYSSVKKIKSEYQKGNIEVHTYVWLSLKSKKIREKKSLIKIKRKCFLKRFLFIF